MDFVETEVSYGKLRVQISPTGGTSALDGRP
jgi:hypothetical protein